MDGKKTLPVAWLYEKLFLLYSATAGNQTSDLPLTEYPRVRSPTLLTDEAIVAVHMCSIRLLINKLDVREIFLKSKL